MEKMGEGTLSTENDKLELLQKVDKINYETIDLDFNNWYGSYKYGSKAVCEKFRKGYDART